MKSLKRITTLEWCMLILNNNKCEFAHNFNGKYLTNADDSKYTQNYIVKKFNLKNHTKLNKKELECLKMNFSELVVKNPKMAIKFFPNHIFTEEFYLDVIKIVENIKLTDYVYKNQNLKRHEKEEIIKDYINELKHIKKLGLEKLNGRLLNKI